MAGGESYAYEDGSSGTFYEDQISYTSWQTIIYHDQGTYTSPELDIKTDSVVDSQINWYADVPAGTDLAVETNLSLDGGATWQGWQVATNRGDIPGITPEVTDLSDARLKYRVTLTSTADHFTTPRLYRIGVVVNILGDESFESIDFNNGLIIGLTLGKELP